MDNNKIIELTTYEEVPQLLKMPLAKSPFPDDKLYWLITGAAADFTLIMLGVYHVPMCPLTILTMGLKLPLDELLKRELINMKAIRETTETREQDKAHGYVVNSGTESRVIPAVSPDKHLQGVTLTGKDYDALSVYYASCDDVGFRRDDSANGQGAKNLCNGVTSSNFGVLKNALKAEGYIDDNSNWTSAGLEFLGVS